MSKVTAGRAYLGNFAPQFAALNDDVLFGEVWSREKQLSPRDRSLITIATLMGAGILDQSLKGHIEKAKDNGVTKDEIVEVITHLAFYSGWPKGWAAFTIAMEVYKDNEAKDKSYNALFGLGEKLDSDNFNKDVYVKGIFDFNKPMLIDNVTFEPGCRNNWHIHQVGQTLFVTNGRGWYQEEGKEAIELHPGDIIEILANVKHWHGAAKDSWITHIAIEDYRKGEPEWFNGISDEEYDKLP